VDELAEPELPEWWIGLVEEREEREREMDGEGETKAWS
jgi:hypothetical protein